MKSFIYIFLISQITLLSSCVSLSITHSNEQNEERKEQVIEHSYDEISHLKIYWSTIFVQEEDNYYVYLYSVTCSHCNSIKNEMIEYALLEQEKIYFVSSSAEHVLTQEVNKYEQIDSLDDLKIKGYPTLLKLENHIVKKNLAGAKEIREELRI